jgi:hypothetical protein
MDHGLNQSSYIGIDYGSIAVTNVEHGWNIREKSRKALKGNACPEGVEEIADHLIG